MDGGDADDLVVRIIAGSDPLFSEDSSKMCARCGSIVLAPGDEEEKSRRRLARWKRKEARRKLVENYEKEIIARWLGNCPICRERIEIPEPSGYGSESQCKQCDIKWTLSILAEHTGTFRIWIDDETERHQGKATGHVRRETINWEWR
jgi:hypothetical protein